MPYSSKSESRIKKLDGVSLSLAQLNAIARMADAIGGEFGWPTAIKNFKKSHVIKDGAWVAKAEKAYGGMTAAYKQADGRYRLIGISTAAVKDLDGETFSTRAMDYDIQRAKELNDYPEFRMFHTDGLGIGRVDTMRRVGIFAIDSGLSYTDPFSLACCEAINKDTSGKWRMSRGFYLLEASGGCPTCGEPLLLKSMHMVAFKCPACGSTHVYGKKGLEGVQFLKTRTFDDTITDNPCVPYTGVAAYKFVDDTMEDMMDKAKLKQKLLDAGVDETLVDERLATVTEKQLSGMDDVPVATLLKEVGLEEDPDAGATDDDYAVNYDQLLGDVTKVVQVEIKKALDEMEIELAVPEFKELDQVISQLASIEAMIVELKEAVAALTASDEQRIQKMVAEAPRRAKQRILRYKAVGKKGPGDDYDEDEGEDGEEDMEEIAPSFPPKKKKDLDPDDGIVYTPNGQFRSLSDSLIGGAK